MISGILFLGFFPSYILVGVVVAAFQRAFSSQRPPAYKLVITAIRWPYAVYKFLI